MPDEVKKDEAMKDEPKTLLWMSYGDIAKILLAFLAGIGATVFTGYWNAKEAKLFYSVSPPVILDNISVVSINITNEGNKEAEDVVFALGVAGKNITNVKVSPEILRAEKKSKDDTLNVELKMLNVGETARIVLTTNNPTPNLEYVANLRGKGVVGKEGSNLEKRLDDIRFYYSITQWAVYVIAALTIINSMLVVITRKKSNKIIDDQNETINKLLDERKYVEEFLTRQEESMRINRAAVTLLAEASPKT